MLRFRMLIRLTLISALLVVASAVVCSVLGSPEATGRIVEHPQNSMRPPAIPGVFATEFRSRGLQAWSVHHRIADERVPDAVLASAEAPPPCLAILSQLNRDPWKLSTVCFVGWPFHCAFSYSENDGGILPFGTPRQYVPTSRVRGAIVIHTKKDGSIVLSLRPLWLGVIRNGALFLAIMIAASIVFCVIRNYTRMLFGKCHRCCYPFPGSASVCPECGEPIALPASSRWRSSIWAALWK